MLVRMRRIHLDGPFLSRRDSGLHRELRGWLYTRRDENQIRRLFESIRSRNTQAVRRLNCCYFNVCFHFDFVPPQLVADCVSQLGINSGKHRSGSTNQSDLQASMNQRIRHFHADVSGAGDDGRARVGLQQLALDPKGIIHRVQGIDTR